MNRSLGSNEGAKKGRPQYQWMVFFTVVLGIFMVNLDSSILTVALPVFQDMYDAGPVTLQWLLVGYLLAMISILPTVGVMSDRFGRTRLFTLGIIMFTLSSLLCGTASSLAQLNFYRIIQGFGGSFITANGMSIIVSAFPEGKRGKPVGLIGSVVSVATLSGPVIGGILVDSFGWRSLFFANLPFGVLSVVFSFLFFKSLEQKRSTGKGFDIVGALLFFIGMAGFILYLSLGTLLGWYTLSMLIFLLVAVLFFGSFFVWEMKHPNPLIDLSFFKIIDFALGNITKYISFVVMMFYLFIMPFYLDGLGYSIVVIGLLMAVQSVANMVFAPLGGLLGDRYSKHLVTMIGMIFIGISCFSIYLLKLELGIGFVIFSIAMLGIGLGLFQSPNNVMLLESLPAEKVGIAGSLMAVVRNFARVSGVCIATIAFYMGSHEPTGSVEIVERASYTFMIAFVLAVAAIFLSAYLFVKAKHVTVGSGVKETSV